MASTTQSKILICVNKVSGFFLDPMNLTEEIRTYWNDYYNKNQAPSYCSPFARDCLPFLNKKKPLCELGCGNGRDSFYFAANGLQVVAVDLSDQIVRALHQQLRNKTNPTFICQDFSLLPTPLESLSFGTIYARFSLHAVKKEKASRAMQWGFNNLISGGLFLIEVRSVYDDLCGQGTKVEGEENAWLLTHYRRFICKDEILSELVDIGFSIEFCQESRGLAVHKNEDPVVIRIFAKKP